MSFCRAAALVAASCAFGGCAQASSLASCDDDLRGVWRADGNGARWMILDHGSTLEGYPLFADAAPTGTPPELETAPRVIDLQRGNGEIRGDVKRRFMRATEVCLGKVPVRVTSCRGDALELVIADPVPPLQLAPCTWGTTAPSRRERWRRL